MADRVLFRWPGAAIMGVEGRPMYARVDPEFAGSPVWGVNGAIAALLARVAEVEAERDRLREREQHFAEALCVADGGQYRNDWNASIQRVVSQRHRLLEVARAYLREYGLENATVGSAGRLAEEVRRAE